MTLASADVSILRVVCSRESAMHVQTGPSVPELAQTSFARIVHPAFSGRNLDLHLMLPVNRVRRGLLMTGRGHLGANRVLLGRLASALEIQVASSLGH